jgi:hypothetical protein
MKTTKAQPMFTSLSFCAGIALSALGCAPAPLPPTAPALAPLPVAAEPPATKRAEVDGAKSTLRVSYDSLKSSDFYQFFRLTEVASMSLPGGVRVVELKPGAFRNSIDIALSLDGAENVTSAHLGLARQWIGSGEKLNPFATDIAASFLRAFASDRERLEMQDWADALRAVPGAPDGVVHLRPAAMPTAPASAKAQEFIRTFEGLESSFRETMRDVEFLAENAIGSAPFLHLEVKLGSRPSSQAWRF